MKKSSIPFPKAAALGIHIILLPAKLKEVRTEAGIITQTERGLESGVTFQQATVVSVGAEVKKEIKTTGVTRNIEEGDECLIVKGSGVPYTENGINYIVIREDAFVAYLPEGEEG